VGPLTPTVCGAALFAYGTLTVAAVMRAVNGAVPPSRPALLPGYARYRVRGQVFPAIIPRAGGATPGVLYDGLDGPALARLDRFEGDRYERRLLSVYPAGGAAVSAYTYVLSQDHAGDLTDEPWDPAGFVEHDLEGYLIRCAAWAAQAT
jgi:gamma-glutamylcyclotransferase (GGCT)/AIG2-like uncharacterized protein YtfP